MNLRNWKSRAALAACVMAAGSVAWGDDTAILSPVEDRTEVVESPTAAPDEAGPVKPVLIVNTPARPVPVTGQVGVTGEVVVSNVLHVVEAARQPFGRSEQFTIEDGAALGFVDIVTVPAGKQLVVTHASINLAEGARVGFKVQAVGNGVVFAAHSLVPMPSGPVAIGGPNNIVASQSLNMIVPAGVELFCSAVRDDIAGDAVGRCSISGYFVDVPEENLRVRE